MRNSTGGLVLGALLTAVLGVLVLALVQGAWLSVVMHMIQSNQSAGIPGISTTPVSGFSLPTPRAPGHVGEEMTTGDVAIRVTTVSRTTSARSAGVSTFQELKRGEEYLLVGISVRCLSVKEACHVTGFDFGVRSASGRDASAEFTSSSSGLKVFEGGTISPGQSMSGSLVFIVYQNDHGYILNYPRMFAFGSSAEVILGP